MSKKWAALEYFRNVPLSTSYPDWDACADSVHILISKPVQKDVELLPSYDQVEYSFTTKYYRHFCMVQTGASLEVCDWRGPSGCCIFLPLNKALLVNDCVPAECVLSEYLMMDKNTGWTPLPCALRGQRSVLWNKDLFIAYRLWESETEERCFYNNSKFKLFSWSNFIIHFVSWLNSIPPTHTQSPN